MPKCELILNPQPGLNGNPFLQLVQPGKKIGNGGRIKLP